VQLKQALQSALARLQRENVASPQMNAELLLRFVLGCDRAYLFAHPERELTEDEESRYNAALAERARGVPAQYITGHQEFWGLDLIVSPAVLIPRPETEHLIETVLELRASGLAPGTLGAQLRIADLGTGSGCIALALAKEMPTAEIHATDISAAALEIARANAVRLQLEARIHFHRIDLTAGLQRPFDLIVSNPPYVGQSESDQVQLEVRKFEPQFAVFAGPWGTEVIDRIIPQAHELLRPGGWLVLEISESIEPKIRVALSKWEQVQVTADLQQIPRVIRARKP
jgi:release factor glutamine methyltransferase